MHTSLAIWAALFVIGYVTCQASRSSNGHSFPTQERKENCGKSFVKLESCGAFLDQWIILWMQWCWKCDSVDFTSDDVSTCAARCVSELLTWPKRASSSECFLMRNNNCMHTNVVGSDFPFLATWWLIKHFNKGTCGTLISHGIYLNLRGWKKNTATLLGQLHYTSLSCTKWTYWTTFHLIIVKRKSYIFFMFSKCHFSVTQVTVIAWE